MALGAMAVRRLVLRRGAAALLGVALAPTSRVAQVPGIEPNSSVGVPQSPQEDAESRERRALSDLIYRDRIKLYRENQLRADAFYCQDPDLVVLASTSQSWRAGVMKDRLRRQYGIGDELDQRLNSIWRDPLDKVRELAAAWIRKVAS